MGAQARSESGNTLIVVSNRLPYNLPKDPSGKLPKRNVGGLVNALEPVLAEYNGSWIGWDGVGLSSAAAVEDAMARQTDFRTQSGVELHGVPLSDREISRYYHGLSNRTLWPLFHNLLTKSVFNTEDWDAYVRVNERFARTVLSRAAVGDRVWVQDYHLILLPKLLREMGFVGRIDFFLHIPFPAPELLLALPWREEVIQGFLCADAVAFHIDSYRANFVRAVESLCDTTVNSLGDDSIELKHRWGRTIAAVSPIGIDVDDFERIAALASVEQEVQRLREAHGDRKLLFSADRLDYTKGISERLLGLERFLSKYPERAGTFALMQVVVPSRNQVEEYRNLKREIDRQVGRINGEYGRDGWIPVHYEYRALGREDLVAHYRAAHVALVTPLRDGMNLVAPEFVASRTDMDGVLIVSEFAGVAERLHAALFVNPYDVDDCAEAILRALEMPPAERASRMGGLRSIVRDNTTTIWARRCLGIEAGAEAAPNLAPRLREVPVGEPFQEKR